MANISQTYILQLAQVFRRLTADGRPLKSIESIIK